MFTATMGEMGGPKAQIEYVDEGSGKKTRVEAGCGRSLLAIAMENGVSIEHACGGVGGCSTCHVRIIEGKAILKPASDAELDQVEQAPGYGPDSRLACQAIVMAAGLVRCVIPKWNRNTVREG